MIADTPGPSIYRHATLDARRRFRHNGGMATHTNPTENLDEIRGVIVNLSDDLATALDGGPETLDVSPAELGSTYREVRDILAGVRDQLDATADQLDQRTFKINAAGAGMREVHTAVNSYADQLDRAAALIADGAMTSRQTVIVISEIATGLRVCKLALNLAHGLVIPPGEYGDQEGGDQ